MEGEEEEGVGVVVVREGGEVGWMWGGGEELGVEEVELKGVEVEWVG